MRENKMKVFEEKMEINDFWQLQEELLQKVEQVLTPILEAHNVPEWIHEYVTLGAVEGVNSHIDVYCAEDNAE